MRKCKQMADTNDHCSFSLINNRSESAGKSETDHSDTLSTQASHSPGTDAVEAYLWDPSRPREPFDAMHYYRTAPSGDGAHSGSSHTNEPETDSETAQLIVAEPQQGPRVTSSLGARVRRASPQSSPGK